MITSGAASCIGAVCAQCGEKEAATFIMFTDLNLEDAIKKAGWTNADSKGGVLSLAKLLAIQAAP